MAGGMVVTAIVFFPAAPFFLFMHGKDTVIPKGDGNYSIRKRASEAGQGEVDCETVIRRSLRSPGSNQNHMRFKRERRQLNCGEHGWRNGYIICTHVLARQVTPAHIVRATPWEMGEILCVACFDPPLDDLKLICESCAIVHGHLPSN
jgi:hypothetical protein